MLKDNLLLIVNKKEEKMEIEFETKTVCESLE